MDKVASNWNDEKFKAYVMIYAAQSDQVETEDEKDYLESNFDPSLLKEVYKEINQDNDFSRIQKIMSFVKAAEQMVFSSLQKLFKVS